MQEVSNRLIDEAISFEAIKNTFRLSWELIVLNKNFTFTAMSMLLLLNILSAFLGVLAMVMSGILSMAIQIYVARLVYGTENIEAFVEEVKQSKLEKILSSNIFTATGAYLGTITIFLGLMFLLVLVVQSMGINLETMDMEQLMGVVQIFILPVMIFLLLLSYLHPLVQSNIALAKDFKEGYRAVFTLFSPTLWKQAFQNHYFKYVVLLILIIGSGAFLMSLLIALPGINLLANFIVIVVMYLYMVLMSVASMMARRISEVC
jgi:hypothetical protein